MELNKVLLSRAFQTFLMVIILASCVSNKGLREIILSSESNNDFKRVVSGSSEYLIKEVDDTLFKEKLKVYSFRNYDAGTHPIEIIYAVKDDKAYTLTNNLDQINDLLFRLELFDKNLLGADDAKKVYIYKKESNVLYKVFNRESEMQEWLSPDALQLISNTKIETNCFVALRQSELLEVCYFLSNSISFEQRILLKNARKANIEVI